MESGISSQRGRGLFESKGMKGNLGKTKVNQGGMTKDVMSKRKSIHVASAA